MKISLDTDIRSLSDFRANTASYVQKVKSDRRPLVLTQNGRSAAVLVDVEEYQRLLDKVELLEELAQAKNELDRGEGIPHDELFKKIKSKYSL